MSFIAHVGGRQVFVQDAQSAFGVEDEDLCGAAVVDGLFRISVAARDDAQAMELERIAGDRAEVVEHLDVDGTKLDSHAGLLVEVFAAATGNGEAAGFGAIPERGEHGGIGSVEFF